MAGELPPKMQYPNDTLTILTPEDPCFYLCPYSIFNWKENERCYHHPVRGIRRMRQHLTRTHTNWCNRCKKSFYTPKELDKHKTNGDCEPQKKYPVGYLDEEILNKCVKAVARASNEEKYGVLYQTLFNCQLPADICYKFYGPPQAEAYGQAMVDTLVRSIVNEIAKTDVCESFQLSEIRRTFFSILHDAASSLRNPTDTQRQELSRLAMETAQNGLRTTSLSGVFSREPYGHSVENSRISNTVALPVYSNPHTTPVMQGGQDANPAYPHAQNLGYGQPGLADAYPATQALHLDPFASVGRPPNASQYTVPPRLGFAPDNNTNLNGMTGGEQYANDTEHYSRTARGVRDDIGPPLIYVNCVYCADLALVEDTALSAGSMTLCDACNTSIMTLNGNT